MAEETTTTGQEAEAQAGASDATVNTEAVKPEQMIPKSRFDEVNKRLHALEAERAKDVKARDEAERKRLEDDQKWQDLYKKEAAAREERDAQIAAMQATQRQAATRASISKAAADFADPDDAWRFIDPDSLQVDDAGNVTNAKQVVDELAKSKPYLLKAAKPAPGVQPGPRPVGGGQVSDAEINAFAGQYNVMPRYVKQVTTGA